MRHLSRHAYALARRGVEVDGFADVHGVCAHFDSQRRWTNEELLLPGQVADLALIAALCSEEGVEVDGEPAEGCYLGAH